MRYSYPTSDFTKSNGVVAFDSLFREIDTTLDPAIVNLAFSDSETFFVDFESELSAPEIATLDGIVASHSGIGLPDPSWTSKELGLSSTGTVGLLPQGGPNGGGSPQDGVRILNDGGVLVPVYYQGKAGLWVKADGTAI